MFQNELKCVFELHEFSDNLDQTREMFPAIFKMNHISNVRLNDSGDKQNFKHEKEYFM